jgi:hypothetical protein
LSAGIGAGIVNHLATAKLARHVDFQND